ncbi:MAG: response regulator [Bacteroidales bacterium]|nr:response regulator [Bacteroidales bacterium]MBN2821292.1 response regulator [Bacteroidales bacterium]
MNYCNLNQIPLAIGISNIEGKISYINSAFTEVFGYVLDEISTLEKWSAYAYPDEKYRLRMFEHWHNDIIRYQNGEKVSPRIYNISCKDSTIKKIEVSFTIDDNNILTIFNDITEYIAVNHELNGEYNLLTKINELSPNIIYIFDLSKKSFTYLNKGIGEYLGNETGTLPEKNTDQFYYLLHPEDKAQFKTIYKDINEWNKSYLKDFECRLKHSNGEFHYFFGQEKVFERDENGTIISLFGTLTNISSRKKAPQDLSESEKKYQTLIEALPDLIVVTDYDDNILFSNKNLEGIAKASFLNLHKNLFNKCSAQITQSNDLLETFNMFLAGDEMTSKPIITKCHDENSNILWYSTMISKISYNSKPALQYFIRNISQIKNFQEEQIQSEVVLRQANSEHIALNEQLLQSYEELKATNEALQTARLKAQESEVLKTAFLQNMSHEIRTPLNGILGFTSLLTDPKCSPEQQAYYSRIINDSSEQLMNIVDDIINISKLETGQSEIMKDIVDPEELIKELIVYYTPKAKEKNLSLVYKNNMHTPKFLCVTDQGKLWQILNNLINNAIKFSMKGDIETGFVQEYNKIKFWVKDQGIGIDRAYHQKIFERFRQIDLEMTRTYGGTGLGLTIAKANAELLGGNIWVESSYEKGSTFFFYIGYTPVETAEKVVVESLSIDNEPENDIKLTILVAEDEEINFLLIEEILSDLNAKVLHAKNGKEAVDLVDKDDIDIVLMDIKMPVMTGYEALEIIKSKHPELPVIAQTAYAFISDKQKAINAGFDEYIAKPIKKNDLILLINKLIK